jgi:oxygen-independent coproporphyrinogen-3 oxidase
MSFGIYLHMPFCRRRCPYCDFYKKVPHAGEVERFPYLLRKELEYHNGRMPFTGLEVSSIYFGGGTPSLHPPGQINDIIETIQSLWRGRADAEITLEANPGTVGFHELKELRASGVNRLSLGLQSFSQRKLQQLFRDHNMFQGCESFRLARAAGFTNISVDLIYGVPGETSQEWQNDLVETLRLKPDHVSLYNLEYHSGTPFYRWREKGKLLPPSEGLELEMYLMAHEELCGAGYEHYEVSNFARSGSRSRHNMLYWTGELYLGVGPSAHSYDGDRTRSRNHPDLSSWTAAMESVQTPLCETEYLADTQMELEWLSLRLRLSDGVSHREAAEKVGPVRTAALWREAAKIPAELMDVQNEHLTLRPRGWFCMNDVALKLFAAFDRAVS